MARRYHQVFARSIEIPTVRKILLYFLSVTCSHNLTLGVVGMPYIHHPWEGVPIMPDVTGKGARIHSHTYLFRSLTRKTHWRQR